MLMKELMIGLQLNEMLLNLNLEQLMMMKPMMMMVVLVWVVVVDVALEC